MKKNNPVVKLPPYIINRHDIIMPFSQAENWGITQLKIKQLHDLGYTGKGIKIAILDTGVDTSHPDLKIKECFNYTSDKSLEDKVGHGTHVAGIIGATNNEYGVIGVAPDAEIYSYKVLSDGTGTFNDVIKALNNAADRGMHIINMSLGAPSLQDFPELKKACQYAVSKGCILVCAAGNTGMQDSIYPAKYEECFAVGAIDSSFKVSEFSSFGSHLDICGPGSKILSTYINGKYVMMSGTSMATPFVSGCIALMLQAGVPITYDNVTQSTIDIVDPSFDDLSGFGVLDPNIAISNFLNKKTPVPVPTKPTKNNFWVKIKNTLLKLLK